MDCFQYPIDTKYLLRKKLRLKKELLENATGMIEKRIAVLGGSTTNEIVDQLELFLLNYGIKPTFYQSEYAQFWQDAMYGNAELDAFAPDVIYFHTNWRNVSSFPTTAMSVEEIDTLLSSEYRRFEMMWDRAAVRYGCMIVQDNFDRPAWRLLGNADIADCHGKTNFLQRLNQKLYEYSQTHKNFYVNDVDYLAANYGLEQWSNPLFWHMYKYSLCLDAIPYLAKSVADIVKSIYGKNKKVLVCDLDNTLWGGVVGDDGVEGIEIGPEIPTGQVYSEVQSYIKELKSTGVLLAVNSKNDYENAIAGLNHPDGVLKPDDFAAVKANWENKDRNMQAIAKELNLGIDSFVFIDDNPTEREIMKQANFGVAVPTMERVEEYIRMVDRGGYFEVTTLSEDDLNRNAMYKANSERAQLEQELGNYDDFLKSLQMRATIRGYEEIYVQRIAQLTNKSNQFNLTTLRCSESDIRQMMASPDYLCLYGKLEDRFGDNGVVSVLAGERKEKTLHMRLWLMSCRVLKRGMEDAMLDTLVSRAASEGIETIVGYYYPTPKNGMVKDFYERMGFVRGDEEGVWTLSVAAFEPHNPYILINGEEA